MAETTASTVQPTASLMTAAVMAPMRVRTRSYSIMIRPRMGTAVMEKAVAMNRA